MKTQQNQISYVEMFKTIKESARYQRDVNVVIRKIEDQNEREEAVYKKYLPHLSYRGTT